MWKNETTGLIRLKMNFIQLTVVLMLITQCLVCEARPRDIIKECTDDTFILGIVECVALKFEPIRPSTSYSYKDDHLFTERFSLDLHDAKDIGIRENYLAPTISNRLSNRHKQLLNHLYDIGKAIIDKEYEVMAIEKLKHVDFQDVLNDYIVDILHHVELFTKNYYNEDLILHSETTNHKDDCSSLCVLLPQFCNFCDGYSRIDRVDNVLQCLKQFQQSDFEDNILWLRCFFSCEDLIPMSGCIKEHFSQCGKWSVIGDVVIRAFADFLKLDSCLLNVVAPDNITIAEGGTAEFVELYSYMPPGALCVDLKGLSEPLGMIRALGTVLGVILGNSPDCLVQIQMSLQNFWNDLAPHIDRQFPPLQIGRPKCHNNNALRQAVIGYHEYASGVSSCIINITTSNWNVTHKIPIWPSVDMKKDGDVTTNFTIKLKVDNKVDFNKKIQVTIKDEDPGQVTLCQATGDPHLTTFDGHYYNNLYDGYFYLYRNTYLPYQVQVIFQRCNVNGNASCTCAVAVKSRDSVFVVDKCRRLSEVFTDSPTMKVILFTNGNLSSGTRIFQRADGLEYNVILPTGAKVAIAVSNDFLNVYMTPSTYDWKSTEGLCGVFDANITNDLQLPDGNLYTGPGTEIGEQPRNFSKSWRVPERDQIFQGTMPEVTDEDGPFCKCNHVLIKGVSCQCGYGEIIETCDDNLNGEMFDALEAITRRSNAKTESIIDIDTDDVDLDETFEPPDIDWSNNVLWNKTYAEKMCKDWIDSANELVIQCKNRNSDDFLDTAVSHCIQDIQITDNDAWKWAAIESAKRKCHNDFLRGIDLSLDDYISVENSTCLNDCNARGECIRGTCDCTSPWTGGDCSIPNEIAVVTMKTSSLCDSRHENCSFATVYGKHFVNDVSMKCEIFEGEISKDTGLFSRNGNKEEVAVLYISPFQVSCYLPKESSYEITLKYSDTYKTNSFFFMVYDSACYKCDVEANRCFKNEENFCIIDQTCFYLNESNPEEPCQYCNGVDEWDWFGDEKCNERKNEVKYQMDKAERDHIIRVSVACILTTMIIILTVVLFLYSKRKPDIVEEYQGTDKGKEVLQNNTALSNINFTMKDENCSGNEQPIHTPRIKEIINADKGYVNKGNLEQEHEIARKSAQEKRRNKNRTSSTTSTHSVQSRGLGGGGPLAFTQYQQFSGSEEDDYDNPYSYVSVHYDKGMGAHATPPITRKPYNNVSVTTWF